MQLLGNSHFFFNSSSVSSLAEWQLSKGHPTEFNLANKKNADQGDS